MKRKPFVFGILGAGLGSRLQSKAKAKPLALVAGQPLLAHLLQKFLQIPESHGYCALREELLSDADRASLPQSDRLKYLFVNTESSLHTMGELVDAISTHDPEAGGVLFSMADSVLQAADFTAFVAFCEGLAPGENALLVTRFVDDEKPLWVQADAQGRVKAISSEKGDFVTSGLYYLSPEARALVPQILTAGVHKMRNFLLKLLESGAPMKVFVVNKTIDVDHPSDLEQAEAFLRGPQKE